MRTIPALFVVLTIPSIASGALAGGAAVPPSPSSGAGPAAYPPPSAYGPAIAAEPIRTGLTFGFGISVGSLIADCEECDSTFEAGGFDARIGFMIAPRIALVVDSWAMLHHESFLTVYQHIGTVGARVWATPRLWLQGGIGVAIAGYQWDGILVEREDRTERSPGLMFGAGYELLDRGNMVLDLQARFGTGFYDKDPVDGYVVKGHSAGVGAALQWY